MSYMTDKDKYKVYTVSENASSIDFIFSKEKKAPLFIYFYDYNGSQGESVVQGRCKQVLYTHYSQTLQFVCHLSLSLSLSLTLWYGFGGWLLERVKIIFLGVLSTRIF